MHLGAIDDGSPSIDDGVMDDRAAGLLDRILQALPLPGPRPEVLLPPGGTLPSAFAVSDLAQASIGAAGAALARLAAGPDGVPAP